MVYTQVSGEFDSHVAYVIKKLYNYLMNIFDKQRVKHGDTETKVEGVKSRVSRELKK